MMDRITYACPKCGSEHLQFRALSEWNFKKQAFELSFDFGASTAGELWAVCMNCDNADFVPETIDKPVISSLDCLFAISELHCTLVEAFENGGLKALNNATTTGHYFFKTEAEAKAMLRKLEYMRDQIGNFGVSKAFL